MIPRICLAFTLFACSLTSAMAQSPGPEGETPPGFNEATFAGLEWRGIGPALMSGRIADLAIDPTDRNTWYVAVGSGGVWKTENRGTTWQSIFDGQGSYSIGDVTLDPNDPETVWVGSGENVSGRHVGYGDGVYRSRDGGRTWENMGLEDSERIGNIVIDPRDSDVIYVAAHGPLWSGGGQRGLFKSTDGGERWEKILGGGPYTGVNEVHMDPRDPDVLYAVTWQRMRNVAVLMNGGPETGIHKSTDGGETWRELTNGLPEEDMGKVGLAISPQNPDVIYATVETARRTGGFYRSADGGENWEKRNDYLSGGTGPHYYQELYASPHAFDRVYQADVQLHVTNDGGADMAEVPGKTFKHSDHHAMAFDPDDPDYLMVGTDGGIYESFDLGQTWRYVANLPVTQFYKVAVDYAEPFYNVYGGTQDNNTQGGPSRTDDLGGIANRHWFITLFGDGHQPAVDPTNPNVVYSEWQEGNLTRTDRATGEIVYIQPQPAADEPTERFNWDAPILISPHDPARLYYASHRVWRSDNRGDSWTPVSGDLTRDVKRLEQPIMGRTWSWDAPWDLYAMSEFSTITSLSESPVVEGLLYVGTDDGLVQVSEDGGENWRRIDSLPGVPAGYFVNDIKADLHDADTVYVAVDNHKAGDFAPYLLVSNNRGRSWRSIAAGLPDRHLVWRLVQDHVDPELLFIGTEFGVFFSPSGGGNWTKLSGNAPTIPFRDLAIQQRENDLVGATFGRGFWILDDYSPLRELTAAQLREGVTLFGVRDAHWYIPRRALGSFRENGKGYQGDGYFVAPNPPFGAVFTYYLAEGLTTRKEQRQEREKAIAEQDGDISFPGWERIETERLEEDPAIVLTVRDASGAVIRRIEGPAEAGFHRVNWDLKLADPRPWTPEPPEPGYIALDSALAAPGEYSVSIAQRIDGDTTDLGQQQNFTVRTMRTNSLGGAGPEAVAEFQQRVSEMSRQVAGAASALDAILVETGAIKDALARSRAAADLRDRARALELEAHGLKIDLAGDPDRALVNDQRPVSIERRVSVAQLGTFLATYGPTPLHEESLNIAETEFADVRTAIERIVGEELPALRADLDAAGVPWTPGRGVPADG